MELKFLPPPLVEIKCALAKKKQGNLYYFSHDECACIVRNVDYVQLSL